MAQDYLMVVTLNKISAIPEDAVQNQFAFHFENVPTDTDYDALVGVIRDFYVDVSGPSTSWFAACLPGATDSHLMELYLLDGHLDGSNHGAPVFSELWTLPNANTTLSLPNELAVCLSFHSDFGTDVEFGTGTRPRARDRGRVFLGPWGDVNITSTGNKEGRVWEDLRDAICESASTNLIDAAAALDWTWCVWSRANEDLRAVVGGWCDNAWDTQRRRGTAATLRSTF